jgi:hypothetical protein
MQLLRVKVKQPNGKEETVTMKIIRSWQDASGLEVYLHSNGTYGYKNGRPVKSAEELGIIGDSRQYEAAMRWWENKGGEKSREEYGDTAAPKPSAPEIFYHCYPVEHSGELPPAGPYTEFGFELRPVWWGVARIIEIDGVIYEMERETEDPDPGGTKKAGKKAKAKAEDF